ncbi:MAG: transketolase [Burkholderiaceae bacterium]
MVANGEPKLQFLCNEALKIRRNIWRSLHGAGSGHMGGALSAADLLAALYFHHMRFKPEQPDWPDRDRFVLSKGHANAALGAVLAQAGLIKDEILDQFYDFDSLFGMHPDIKLAGVEMSTGGLGHGLSVGLGMALGARLQRKDFRVSVMIGDGELQEGSNWEAAMAAAHQKVSNLTAILDYNKVQQSGHVSTMMSLEPAADKWRAFGWSVREINGHDMGEIVSALDDLPFTDGRPSVIIAHTVKGKGVSFSEDTHLWHNNVVSDDVYRDALAELGEPT